MYAEEAVNLLCVPLRSLFFGIAYVATTLVSNVLLELWMKNDVSFGATIDNPTLLLQIHTLCLRINSQLESFSRTVTFAKPRSLLFSACLSTLEAQSHHFPELMKNFETYSSTLRTKPRFSFKSLFFSSTTSSKTNQHRYLEGQKLFQQAEIEAVKLNRPIDRALAIYWKNRLILKTSDIQKSPQYYSEHSQELSLCESIFVTLGAHLEAQAARSLNPASSLPSKSKE